MAALDLENSESAVAEKMRMAKPPFFAGNASRSRSSAEHYMAICYYWDTHLNKVIECL